MRYIVSAHLNQTTWASAYERITEILEKHGNSITELTRGMWAVDASRAHSALIELTETFIHWDVPFFAAPLVEPAILGASETHIQALQKDAKFYASPIAPKK